jgi:hypothetical protein
MRHDSEKKTAHAAEQDRPDVLKQREDWFESQLDLDPARLVFIDETGASTNMARLRGRAPRGKRLRTPPPVQEESASRLGALIGCCHVSGLCCGEITCRGPVWEFGDQVHIIGTRSRRDPCAWFS